MTAKAFFVSLLTMSPTSLKATFGLACFVISGSVVVGRYAQPQGVGEAVGVFDGVLDIRVVEEVGCFFADLGSEAVFPETLTVRGSVRAVQWEGIGCTYAGPVGVLLRV
jgi:hypothetical protein